MMLSIVGEAQLYRGGGARRVPPVNSFLEWRSRGAAEAQRRPLPPRIMSFRRQRFESARDLAAERSRKVTSMKGKGGCEHAQLSARHEQRLARQSGGDRETFRSRTA